MAMTSPCPGCGKHVSRSPSARMQHYIDCARSHPHDDPCPDHDLRTEVARPENLLATSRARIAELESERDRYREALERFAALGCVCDEPCEYGDPDDFCYPIIAKNALHPE